MPGAEQNRDGLEVYVMLQPWPGSEMKRNGKPYKVIPRGLQRLHNTTLILDPDGNPRKIDETYKTHKGNVKHFGQLAVRVTSSRDWYPVTAPEDVSKAVFFVDPQDPNHHVVGGNGLSEEVRASTGSVPCVLTGALLSHVGILYPGEPEISWTETSNDSRFTGIPTESVQPTSQLQS